MFSELEFPNVDRLDAENAQFRPENRIPRAKQYVYMYNIYTYMYNMYIYIYICNIYIYICT